jgi:hypothetical protein
MSNENDIDFKYLFEKLGVSSDDEKIWTHGTNISFQSFYKAAQKQPISSFIRVMEERCRAIELIFSSFFKIDYEYLGYKPNFGSCMLFPGSGDHELNRFHITLPLRYSDEAHENDARTIIAHEIGHLYVAVQRMEREYNEEKRKTHPTDCRNFLLDCLNSERRKELAFNDNKASIIGAFILNNRSIFYKNKVPVKQKEFCKSFREIVNSFENLKKEKK